MRAAVFFAGLSLALSQLAINTVLNAVSTGMDIAGLWPRFINIRRGAYILAIVSLEYGIGSNKHLLKQSRCSLVWYPILGKSPLQRLRS